MTAQALIDEGNFEDFNSHAHVERDNRTDYILSHAKISTHTLTWSVTPPVQSLSATTSYFNSHAHVERDCRFFLCRLFLCHFNSHAHVERDSAIALANKSTTISTHTLTWSVTKMLLTWVSRFWISTHTLTWSVTR